MSHIEPAAPTGQPAEPGPEPEPEPAPSFAEQAQLAELVTMVADAVLAHPAVAGLHGDRFGAIASYLPGRRVDGVRVLRLGGPVELAVTLRLGHRAQLVADQLRTTVRQLAGQVPVDITIADVVEDNG